MIPGFIIALLIGIAVGYFGLGAPAPPSQVPAAVQSTAWLQPRIASTAPPRPTETTRATATPELLQVYVSGAVTTAQVITLPRGSLVRDALEAIGGPAPHADLDAINLAEPVSDYQHVLVPEKQTSEAAAPTADNSTDTQTTHVDLNTADATELETLPHIGPSRAADIIAYRETNGPFATIEELKNVKGIGDATFADLAPLITVD